MLLERIFFREYTWTNEYLIILKLFIIEFLGIWLFLLIMQRYFKVA